MLEAFVLSFWAVWSADRELYPLSESLWFTIIAAFFRHLAEWEMPLVDGRWVAFNSVLWLYTALVFILINRLSSSFIHTLLLTAAAGIGYFHLALHLPDWL
ncbi:multidrug transporter MatE [Bergeriella denitrificans]|uniref:Integral membrane protein n=1 Tax=Bergeriella denitrificans TaxID=494 RepID=A0A378UDE0_BERDE|nr:multidrug transporter MatE [Bergeriella denitrificans]STZ75424.1 Uncharacterised protein [Bergeriella denitrificans]